MQVKYITDVTVADTDLTYSKYAVIDGPADNAWHLFNVYVNVDDLTINVRSAADTGPLYSTTGKASTVSEFMTSPDGTPVGMTKRVTGPSIHSYVARRAGRLTAQANGVGVQIQPSA